MALIDQRSGCKVGWDTYDDEAEAQAAAERASKARERKFALGYDFGYQWPGSIQHHAATETQPERWTVVTP